MTITGFADLMKQMSAEELRSLGNVVQDAYKAKDAEEKAKDKQHIKVEEKHLRDAHVAEATCMDLPLDWNNRYASDKCAAAVQADSIADGLVLSVTNLGTVDIKYIAQVCGRSCSEVIDELKGSIYQNPECWGECFYKGWETADDYLSGNLRRKYIAARQANKLYGGYFSDNVQALKSIVPAPLFDGDIYVTLGSPWVPPDVIDEFIIHLLGEGRRSFYSKGESNLKSTPVNATTAYNPDTGVWEIHGKGCYNDNLNATKVYGTNNMSALHIIEKSLNMKSLKVYDNSPETGKRVLDKEETAEALEKQRFILKEFQKWVWQDERRKKRLAKIYDCKFRNIQARRFDGRFLALPGLSPDITLYPYQKDAVARILFSPNTLLAHDVGAGKTYIMVVAGMELRRLGISRKNMYIVPNNIAGQWQSIFRKLYPHAKLLAIEPKDFIPAKRPDALAAIRKQDFDAIILTYGSFGLIPIDVFERLGINTLFVDEAHNFKNINIKTKMDNVLGISPVGSRKCNEMLEKVRCVQRMNNGRGVVFATGTPITNSVTDIFSMQCYLQYGELRLLDLHNFDGWAANFGEKSTEFEIDVDTSSYRLATRFSKFHNLPELTNLLAQIADFHKVDENDAIPKLDGYSDSLIAKTPELAVFLEKISNRAEAIRSGTIPRTLDNMLKLTTDGRKAALDIRLAIPTAVPSNESKVLRCAENVWNIYCGTAKQRLTQLVFCDFSTPKAGFNLYNELKRLLVDFGVREAEIAFVHDCDTPKRRARLFAQMQSGEIRVLIGSTFKLGTGVNVQRKLVAIHHLDVPWRPADMTQREGRILRQGNENKHVQIFRYITDGSFDAYSWQLLENKQRFICQLLSGSVTERSAADVDNVVLDYADVKALAVGNPLVKKRVETANELSRAILLMRRWTQAWVSMQEELHGIPMKIAEVETEIASTQADIVHYLANRREIKNIQGHRRYGALILGAISRNAMQKEEKRLFHYQCFDIILPAYMPEEKPFVWIAGNGRYLAEMGDNDIGCIKRIDNKLDKLPELLEKRQQELGRLTARYTDLAGKLEREKENVYLSQVKRLRSELSTIDKKLGVKQ